MAEACTMPERRSLEDLIVVIPGITGSVLASHGKEVWSLSWLSLITNLLTQGRAIDRLALADGLGEALPGPGEGDPHDGVEATRLMSDVHVIPGLWSPIKGYSGLLQFFRDRFDVRESDSSVSGNLMAFPYDWRLSNAVNGRRLAEQVLPRLDSWRKTSGNP